MFQATRRSACHAINVQRCIDLHLYLLLTQSRRSAQLAGLILMPTVMYDRRYDMGAQRALSVGRGCTHQGYLMSMATVM